MSDTVKDLSGMLEKLKEVESVFKFGEKMVPVVEGFVSFISDFIPIIEEVNGSIEETRAKIPEASSQIDKVTSATELAITEVLDKVDEITNQLSSLDESINEIIERRNRVEDLVENLQKVIKGNESAEVIFGELMEELDIGLTLETMKNKLQDITESTDQITMSLQVQDITSQQLAAVNHLIISVQHKLGSLLSVFDDSMDKSQRTPDLELPGTHFDANASYEKPDVSQDMVDSIVSSETTTQDDIDKLFS
ncbi:MAG: protein phosphatase CheZ [Melioribacteraceae bacterium]